MAHFPNSLTPLVSAPPVIEPSQRKRKADEPMNDASQETDRLKLIFETFFVVLSRVEDGRLILTSYEEAVDELASNEDILYCLHQTPLKKVKRCFKKFMSELNVSELHKERIDHTLKLLYPLSLTNSSTYEETLPQVYEALPNLKEKLKHDVPKEIHTLLRNARGLIGQAKDCRKFEEINATLPKIDKILQQLSEFRGWKQFQDKEENQRILDLARHCKKRKADIYSTIIKDYKPTVAMLEPLSSDLTAASHMVVRLYDLKVQLQKQKAMMMELEQKENPLEIRFLKAFGTPFYDAFAYHFWNLLWTSFTLHHSEIEIILEKIPDWDKATREVVGNKILSLIWSEYFPEIEFLEWILAALGNVDSTQLDKLESDLQSLTKNINQIHEDWEIDKHKKHKLEEPHRMQMETLCINATTPSFSTLRELKSFLTNLSQ